MILNYRYLETELNLTIKFFQFYKILKMSISNKKEI